VDGFANQPGETEKQHSEVQTGECGAWFHSFAPVIFKSLNVSFAMCAIGPGVLSKT
jgi:hypothetical protein